MHQHAQTSVILLNELSQWTVSAGRPSFLPPEHLDFLKGLDQIDSYSNSPPIINEDMWATLCRLRRMKVECELKVRYNSKRHLIIRLLKLKADSFSFQICQMLGAILKDFENHT